MLSYGADAYAEEPAEVREIVVRRLRAVVPEVTRMSGGAKEQVGRLLALVPLIQRRGAMGLEEAATTLGVPSEQLVKDLRVLIYCGWPGWLPGDLIEVDLDALDGEGVIRITNADYLSTPLRLSPAEASAMIVALRTLRESADGDTLASLDSALAKLEGAAEDGRVPTGQVDVHVPRGQREAAALRDPADRGDRRRTPGPAHLLRAVT